MDVHIYVNLEQCKDFDEIDRILEGHGYASFQDKYNYLLERMQIVSAQFTGIEDENFETMYCLAKENYLLGYWREQDVA
jgi:hypothetical protein